MRQLGLMAALVVAGCVTAPAPSSRPPAAPGPNPYAAAPWAGVFSELFACNGGAGSNLGPIGGRGEAKLYTPYIHTAAGALLRNPTEGACLSSGFGWRGTADGGGREHTGIDLANPGGGYIYAAADGRVAFAEWRGGYGNVLEIDHGHGVRTLYAHLSEIDLNLVQGAFVQAGAPVARMGSTGNATGVHLHYEVSVDGLKVDPLTYGVQAGVVG